MPNRIVHRRHQQRADADGDGDQDGSSLQRIGHCPSNNVVYHKQPP